jgi:hypothetical protein
MPFHFHHVSNKQREAGEKVKGPDPIIGVHIPFTFFPAQPTFATVVNMEYRRFFLQSGEKKQVA